MCVCGHVSVWRANVHVHVQCMCVSANDVYMYTRVYIQYLWLYNFLLDTFYIVLI